MIQIAFFVVFHFSESLPGLKEDEKRPCREWMEATSGAIEDPTHNFYEAQSLKTKLVGRLTYAEKNVALEDKLERIQVFCRDFRVRCDFTDIEPPRTVRFQMIGEARDLRELLPAFQAHKVLWWNIQLGGGVSDVNAVVNPKIYAATSGSPVSLRLGEGDESEARAPELAAPIRDLAISELEALI